MIRKGESMRIAILAAFVALFLIPDFGEACPTARSLRLFRSGAARRERVVERVVEVPATRKQVVVERIVEVPVVEREIVVESDVRVRRERVVNRDSSKASRRLIRRSVGSCSSSSCN
ncbi:MAG: hypothetical protein QXG97_00105 [Nitrososphaerota archaeon]